MGTKSAPATKTGRDAATLDQKTISGKIVERKSRGKSDAGMPLCGKPAGEERVERSWRVEYTIHQLLYSQNNNNHFNNYLQRPKQFKLLF